jgi:hypothetical protein
MEEVVAAIEAAAPDAAGRITLGPDQLVGPVQVDEQALVEAIGPVRWRGVREGVQHTVDAIREAVERDRLEPEEIRQQLTPATAAAPADGGRSPEERFR